MEFHPVSAIFPMMSEREFSDLVEDIRVHGVREAIWLHPDGRIIDGRNRYRAALEVRQKFKTRTYSGDDDKLVSFVVSLNLHRRHLTESQRAMVAAKVANLKSGRPAETAQICAVSQDEAAKLLNVGRTSVQHAKKVQSAVPELATKVESGELAVSTAAVIAEASEDEQREILATGTRKEIIAKAKEIAHVGRNSGDNEWYTPIKYIQAAREVMGGIDLDPASSAMANEVVKAENFYTKEDDGLVRQWAGRVWMNPPYAQPLVDRFCKRLASAYADGEIEEACVLVNNATETGWFQVLATEASAICFPRGRVKFWHRDKESTPLQGQAVLYFGKNVERFRKEFQFGFVVML